MLEGLAVGSGAHMGRRGCATLMAFLVQAFVVTAMLLAPFFSTAVLPGMHLPAAAPRVIAITQQPLRPHAATGSQLPAALAKLGVLRQPRSIPLGVSREAAMEAPPQPGAIVSGSGVALQNQGPAGIVGDFSPILPAPPPRTSPGRLAVSQGVLQGYLVNRVEPRYPAIARQARVEGTVLLAATIGRQGDIEDLQLISGHPMLAPAAIEAVRQWHYRPYRLNGRPVEVQTRITLVFSLAKP
jgi:protein TonB